VISRLGNQGDAEHKGAELDMVWRASERLTLQGGVAWLDAKITDSDATSFSWLGTIESLEGRKRPYAPDFSYSVAGFYEIPVGSRILTLQADYNWRDDRFGDGLSVIEDTILADMDSYGLLGARVTLSAAGDSPWEMALWGRNLLDEEYFVNITTDDIASWIRIPGEPLSYGIELRYRW